MSGRSIHRVAVFTPLPPTRSGIAAYNHGFLPRLAEHIEITAFVDDHAFGLTESPEGVAVRPASYHDPRRFDLNVFHMGNHIGYHEHIHEALRVTPGLVVLHDMRMADFFRGLEHRRPDLVDVMTPRSVARPADGEIDFAALAPIVRRARSVLVHSDAHAETLRRCFPGTPVFASRLAPSPPTDTARVSPSLLGWPDTALVVGSFGSIGPHKRIDRLILIVAGLRASNTDVRAIVSGWVASAPELERLEALVSRHGLGGHVRFFTDTNEAEMSALHGLCDVAVDLRDAYTGASSMSIATALGHKVLTITAALAEFTDVSHPLLRHVPTEPVELVAQCARMLAEMAHDKAVHGVANTPTAEDLDEVERRQIASVVGDHLTAIRGCMDTPDPAPMLLSRGSARDLVGAELRLTVAGDLTVANGLMEYGRALANVLHGAGVTLGHHPRGGLGASHDTRRDTGRLAATLPQDRSADTELWLANINEFPTIPDEELRPPGVPRRKIIGSWFWELPVLPEFILTQFERIDEIWVGSPFVERTFRQYCDLPITVVPMPIDACPREHLDRRDFGLADDEFLYFFDFDAFSHPARKNPLGLIAAFRRAFVAGERDSHGRRPRLVLKTLHLDSPFHRNTAERLRSEMADIGGIIIEDELDRRELDSLVNNCDVYASLHRAEGLGIGMLEAMFLGKPVISPSYPDKWLFPASEIGFGVPAAMRPIDSSDTALFPEASYVYPEGLSWVEPDLDVAARHMRRLFDEPGLGRRIGERGARLVREHYNARAALTVMTSRLRADVGASAAR